MTTSLDALTTYAGPERRDLPVRLQRNGLAEWLDLHPRALAEIHGEALGALDLTLQAGREAEERIRGMRRTATRLQDRVRALESETLTDALTGAASRRALQFRLSHECAVLRRTGRPFAVFLLDADNLKKINDAHGHPCGDDYLRELSARVRRTVRDIDLVARIGGDEFVILCPGTDGIGAADLARRLSFQLGSTFALGPGREVEMSVSIGWSVARADADTDPDRLLELADAAMYEAKRGRSDFDDVRGFVGRKLGSDRLAR